MIFGCQASIIHTSKDIHIEIQAGITMQGYSAMDICKNNYPWTDIHVFMDISLQLSTISWTSIWISLDFYGYSCIDLLWILDPGLSPFPLHWLKKYYCGNTDTYFGVKGETGPCRIFIKLQDEHSNINGKPLADPFPFVFVVCETILENSKNTEWSHFTSPQNGWM